MNAESHGFTFVKNKTENVIVPGIVTPQPEDLPDTCTCGKCAHKMDMSLQGSWNQVLQILQV